MFLFATPLARSAAPENPVVDAIRTGADRTGTGFDYLLATAQRESALDPQARARTSSAAGLFQFVEQTWLGLVKAEGAGYGLGEQAKAIAARSDGTLVVEDAAARKAILALREDPQVSSVLAGRFTQRNRDVLAAELGREPSGADLYVAHFLGARGAMDLIQRAQKTPQRVAASDFPEAAAANRGIFYDRSNRARGAGEVYAILASSHAQAATRPALKIAQGASEDRSAYTRPAGPAMLGLFQTEARRGPISDAVARIWRANAGEGPRTAALGGFFPRSDEAAPIAAPAGASETADVPAQTGGIATVPLPPPRPTMPAPAGGRAKAAAPAGARPLDLSAFMRWRRA